MASPTFTAQDFRVFDLAGFAERMAAIRGKVSPKLNHLGVTLAAPLAALTGAELFPHVARHARRTVNPPDDTWVAFGPERRGYKKAPHFKIAASRRALRFLFEIGPEYRHKSAWADAWGRAAPRLGRALRQDPDLAWFRSEHDETPAARLSELDTTTWRRLAEELTRTRDGHLVLGRRVDAVQVVGWGEADYQTAAIATFGPLAACFRLR